MTHFPRARFLFQKWMIFLLWAGCLLIQPQPGMAQQQPAPSRVAIDVRMDWYGTYMAYEHHSDAAYVDMSGDYPRFRVMAYQGKHSHVWVSRKFSHPVDIAGRYRYLVFKYRASGVDTNSKRAALSLKDVDDEDMRIRYEPVKYGWGQIIADGQEHELKLDLRKVRKGYPRNPLVQVGISVRGTGEGWAELEVREIAFEIDPAENLPAVDAPVQDDALEVSVVNAQGAPVANATVKMLTELVGMEQTTMTDAQGKASLNPWKNTSGKYSLRVKAPGLASVTIMNAAPGQQVLVVMEKAHDVTGVPVDEAGQPVADAIVSFLGNGREMQAFQWQYGPSNVLTDEQGKWRRDGVPDSWKQLEIAVWHPQFIKPASSPAMGDHITRYVLGTGPAVARVKRGWSISGRVTDYTGKPVAGAVINLGRQFPQHDRLPSLVTREDGTYRVDALSQDEMLMVVTAKGHGPKSLKVIPSKQRGEVTQEIILPPAQTIRFKVVNSKNEPLPGVQVYASQWGDYDGNLLVARTDKEGRLVWNEAPADAIQYSFYGKGINARGKTYDVGQVEHVVVLQDWPRVTGQVVSASTGKPITRFVVNYAHVDEDETYDVPPADRFLESSQQEVENQEGRYELTLHARDKRRYVRIAAEGYQAVISPRLDNALDHQVFDARLLDGATLGGIVLTDQGKPAAGAEVFTVPPDSSVGIDSLTLAPYQHITRTKTDEQGRFSLPLSIDRKNIGVMGVLHESGYMELRGQQIDMMERITLLPWVTIKGVSMKGNEPDAFSKVHSFQVFNPLNPAALTQPEHKWDIRWHIQAQADGQGRYELKLPAGGYELGKMVQFTPRAWTMVQSRHVLLQTDQPRSDLNVGGTGRNIIAQVKWDKQPRAWKSYDVDLQPISIHPAAHKAEYPDELQGINLQASHVQYHRQVTLVDADSRLQALDIPPGTYMLRIAFFEDYWPTRGQVVGTVEKRIVVPPSPGPGQNTTMNLGDIPLSQTTLDHGGHPTNRRPPR